MISMISSKGRGNDIVVASRDAILASVYCSDSKTGICALMSALSLLRLINP